MTGAPPKTSVLLQQIVQSLADLKEILERVKPEPGEIFITSLSVSELKFGFYHANGDKYELGTAQGGVLNGLSADKKARWRIAVSGTKINLPSLYYSDGRGFFPRAGVTPGMVQTDAIRNFTGSVRAIYQETSENRTGVFATAKETFQSNSYMSTGSLSGGLINWVAGINASLQVPTADENRPLNVTMTPAVYLGV
jgi:hypothetical protein